MISRTVTLLLFLIASNAMADTAAWPGGIARIDLGPVNGAAPRVDYQGKRVLVLDEDGRWQAVIGIPLDAPVGRTSVAISDGTTIDFDVDEHAYKEQRLTVSQSYVTPNAEALERIAAERIVIDAALTNWRDATLDGISLKTPVGGPKSSSFGLRRFFNDEPRAPHKGMDIAAGTGEIIVAPRAGIVTATGNFYFNGNTVDRKSVV